MGYLRNLVFGAPVDLAGTQEKIFEAFSVDAESVPPSVFGLTSYATPTAPAARVERRTAIQVPAVKRTRDLIAGTLGSLPLDCIDPGKESMPNPLFAQPERHVPRSVTMTRTFEDVLFEGIAWWLILEFEGLFPSKVKRLRVRDVSVNEDTGKVYVKGHEVPHENLIRFDSPNDGLLIAGARAIRTCLLLDAAAQRHVEGIPPLDYFSPAEGVDPGDDAEIRQMLDGWQAARQSRSTGYVPAALKYNNAGFNPEQLQMADARQHAVLEISRVGGVDPEDLGVSTTSRTYSNAQDRRKALLDFTLGGYRQAFEDRLSMGDVVAPGFSAKFNLSAFLRSDDKTRMETYKVAKEVGALTTPEIRELEDRPALEEEVQS